MAQLIFSGNQLKNSKSISSLIDIGDFKHQDIAVSNKFQLEDESDDIIEFKDIGLGKPLSVEIMTIYTGDAPRKFLGGRPDLLVVSGVKSVETHNAAPRAINLLRKNIKDNEFIFPSAFDNGSAIVYYSPALESDTTLFSFELIVDSFKEKSIQAVSNILGKAGSIPVFAPASTFLLAGSAILNIASEIGKAMESGPFLRDDLPLRLLTPGMRPAKARTVVIANDNAADLFEKHYTIKLEDNGGKPSFFLFNKKNGEKYKGSAPYLIVNIDGHERTNLDNYSPKLASAALIEKFYPKGGISAHAESIESAMELYNDMTFRKKAERLTKQMKSYDLGSEELKKAEKLLEAYQKNIKNDLFKLEKPNTSNGS